ncbi:Arabinogalactan peptide 14 [Spatholobus suberectus]|nr:Arabinogalactan peptide 14 [Spatholobus suberectus]
MTLSRNRLFGATPFAMGLHHYAYNGDGGEPTAALCFHPLLALPLPSSSQVSFLTGKKRNKNLFSEMEALKMKLFFVVVAMLIMAASAAESPAPSPTSDATILFVPTAVASFVVLAFGLLF